MKYVRKITALMLVFVLFCALNVTAFAHEAPDLAKTGSISMTMKYQGKVVPGGTVTAYRVGEIAEDDGNYGFAISLEFAASGADLSDISSAGLAQKLAGYAKEKNLTGANVHIGNDGKAVFPNLKPGLYLIVQTRAAEGYEAVSPFLVSVPMNEDGTYVYDVDATPKMEMLTQTPDEPEPAPSPGKPGTSSSPGPSVPQTGQLNWPVPVLAVLGLCLLLLGWELSFGNRECHET